MKRTIFLATIIALAVLGAATGAKAQVTIGANDAPKVTLDVRGKASTATSADGLMIPSMTGAELEAKWNGGAYSRADLNALQPHAPFDGTLIYVTTEPTSLNNTGEPFEKVKSPSVPGFFFYSKAVSQWVSIKATEDMAPPEVDGVIGNEITDVFPNRGLTRVGSGTTESPFKVGIEDDGVTSVMIANGTIVAVDLNTALRNTIYKDTIVGNEIKGVANATLVRSGSGTDASPYLLARAAITGDVSVPAASNTATLATVTQTNTTSTAAPAHGATFTAIDAVTRDTKGRVTGVNTKTVTLPADNNTTYTAGTGLALSGTTINAKANNGLTTYADSITLGGALTKTTTITAGDYNLAVNAAGTGKFRYYGATASPGANKVLTSDASGYATWQPQLCSATYKGKAQSGQVLTLLPQNDALYIDSLSYIDLREGLWRVDMSIPFTIKDAISNGSVEIVIGLTNSTNFGTQPYEETINNKNGLGGTGSSGSVSTFGNPANTFIRGTVSFFLENNKSGITRYYVCIGRYFNAIQYIPNGIIYFPSGRTGSIYATYTQWAD
ncbi:MAG: hypothetical protein LBR64_07860 [Dysgonamonadaceae bacterium]|nr:hypothetical protein [Dysgonamonadaceae bacterium]